MHACGRLISDRPQKYGRANEATPAKWNKEYKDYSAPSDVNNTAGATGALASTQRPTEKTVKDDVLAAAPIPPVDADPATTEKANGSSSVPPAPNGEAAASAPAEKKKKRKHDGETAEERAERKKKRKEEKKAGKKEKHEEEESS